MQMNGQFFYRPNFDLDKAIKVYHNNSQVTGKTANFNAK